MYKHSLFYTSLLTTPTLISAAFKAALPQITPIHLPHARRQETCPAGWYACPTDGGCCEIGNSCSTNDAGIPICIVPECDPGIVACTEGPISGVCCLEGSTCAFSTCNAGGPPPLSIPLGNGPVSVSSMMGVSGPVETEATPTPSEGGASMSGSGETGLPTMTGDGGETASSESGGETMSTESGDDTAPTGGSTGSPMTTMGNTRTTGTQTASDAPQSTGEANRADSKWGNIVGGLVGMIAVVL